MKKIKKGRKTSKKMQAEIDRQMMSLLKDVFDCQCALGIPEGLVVDGIAHLRGLGCEKDPERIARLKSGEEPYPVQALGILKINPETLEPLK